MPWDIARDKHPVKAVAAIDAIVRLALPPRCPACGTITAADHHFCAPCWAGLRFLGEPCCAGCGAPFAHDRGGGTHCAACLADLPRHAGVRAAVAYGPAARALALRLKYARRTGLARTAALMMVRHLARDTDLLVPVPLHRWRLWSRGFNQAGLIAAELSSLGGIAHDARVLVRRKATPVLRGLGGRARKQAVTGAFAIDPARHPAVRGRAITLIDDVYTSGATTDACVATLLKAGAARVSILCWARVIDADEGA